MYMSPIQKAIVPVARQFGIDPDSIKIIPGEGNRLTITGIVRKYKHVDELRQVVQEAAGANIHVLNELEIR